MEDNFNSVNKLIEFGMSLAIAQQMVKYMNEATTNMKIPGTFQNLMQPKLPKIKLKNKLPRQVTAMKPTKRMILLTKNYLIVVNIQEIEKVR